MTCSLPKDSARGSPHLGMREEVGHSRLLGYLLKYTRHIKILIEVVKGHKVHQLQWDDHKTILQEPVSAHLLESLGSWHLYMIIYMILYMIIYIYINKYDSIYDYIYMIIYIIIYIIYIYDCNILSHHLGRSIFYTFLLYLSWHCGWDPQHRPNMAGFYNLWPSLFDSGVLRNTLFKTKR